MPKSKRNTKVALTKVQKKPKERKDKLVEEIKLAVEKYDNIFVWEEQNMRNNVMKDLKVKEWSHSRFFYGKVNVMAFALGRTEALELHPRLHKVTEYLKGKVGLLFTNKDPSEVKKFFKSFSVFNYAKTGNIASESVMLDAGFLEQFSHSIEPHLRSLGLPVKLNKGTIELTQDYVVCTKGDELKAHQCSILKLLGKQMSEFKIVLKCRWCKDGTFKKILS